MGLRVGLVLAAACLAVRLYPELNTQGSYLGLALIYGVALAVETRHLMSEVASGGAAAELQSH
jgi:hypothetical protein